MFTFNAAATALFEGVTHMRVLFDTDARRVAFEPATGDDENVYRVTYLPSSATISSKAFARQHRVRSGQRFVLTEQDGMFVADVGEPTTALR